MKLFDLIYLGVSLIITAVVVVWILAYLFLGVL